MKKILACVIAAAMILASLGITVMAEETGLAAGENVISTAEPVTVTGNGEVEGTLKITADNAVVTLKGITLKAPDNASAVSVEAKNVELVIEDEVNVTGGLNGAGIYVASEASVKITGTGILNATGNGGSETEGVKAGGAGIGGSYGKGSGEIVIDGATVNARGYGHHASGIGSGTLGETGKISIVNNANVVSYGGYYAEGGAVKDSYGKSNPEGGAAIGGGSSAIIIENSTVNAYGGSKCAGIGADYWMGCELIKITGSTVVAEGGATAAAIGLSRYGDNNTVTADIQIEASTVNAKGGEYGAGIGAGYNSNSSNALAVTTIAITGGKTVAKGGNAAAGIGGGYKGNNLEIVISSDAEVTAVAGVHKEDKYASVPEKGGACAIGSGANGSGSFNGSDIAIADTANIIAVNNGGKSAVETEAIADGASNVIPEAAVTVLFASDNTYDVWDGTADTSWYNDTDKEFTIYTAEELAGLAVLVNGGNTFSGKTVKLGANLNLDNKEWTPVGDNIKKFAGLFDGNGKVINNLYISKPQYGVALFGGASGTVKNFTINNADVHNSSLYTAAVVGCGNCTIQGVTVKGDIEITGYTYIGGIHGNGYSKVSDCHVIGNDGSVIEGSYIYVGGIKGFSGENGQTAINCSVKNVDISGLTYVGGIQGILHYENIVKSCSVENVNVYVVLTPEDAGTDQHDVYCGGLIAGNTSNASYANAYASIENFGNVNSKVIFGDATESEQLIGLERYNRESDTVGALVGGTSYSDINEAVKAAKATGKAIVLYENFSESEITEDIAGIEFVSVGTKSYTLQSTSANLVFCKYTDGSAMYVNKTDVTGNATLKFIPTEDESVFDIAIEADKGKYLNRLSNIDLTFTNANTDYSYEILARADGFVSVNGVPGNDNRYEFHFNGTDKASENGGYVVMGQVKFSGYSESDVDFSAKADTNAAQAAEIADNIVRSYYPEGSVDYDAAKTGKFIDDAKIEGIVYEEATTEVKVVIEFNNNITAGNTAFYNDMTVTLTGANGKVYTGKVGNDADTAEVNYEDGKDLVTFVFPEVVVGENGYYYTATVKGAGYRNATLTKRLTADSADKTYLFWNNVKDVEGDSFLAGDIVKDNIINIYDLSAVVSYFGEEGIDDNNNPGYAKYDLNRDGKIDSKDVAYVLVSWGK